MCVGMGMGIGVWWCGCLINWGEGMTHFVWFSRTFFSSRVLSDTAAVVIAPSASLSATLCHMLVRFGMNVTPIMPPPDEPGTCLPDVML